MKQTIKQIMNWRTLMGTLILIGSLFAQSCKDDEAMKWVDLRYKANDSYTIAASGEESVPIQVKSTDPWEVFSKHPDWCTISPAQGEAETLYDITITYKANTSLDDRTDTVIIKSDYWIGKEVTIIQKGIAYLTLENADDPILEKAESTYSFNVKSNQDWSANVTEGEEWLSIQAGNNGTKDGSVTVKALENKGEQRSGTVVMYDRHGEEVATVTFTQEGVILLPDVQSIRAQYNETQVTVHVESNGEWMVTKADEDADWYSFGKTEYSGNDDIIITLTENSDDFVKKARFQISSKAGEGGQPIVKTITLKQGNRVTPERHDFIADEWTASAGKPSFAGGAVSLVFAGGNCRISRADMKPGTYRFHIKESSLDAQCQHYFIYGEIEVRWMLFKADKTTRCGTSDTTVESITFDHNQSQFTVGMALLENNGNMKLQWLLQEGTGAERQLREISPYTTVTYGENANVIVGVSGGSATYDWWEYTAPIDWGDE